MSTVENERQNVRQAMITGIRWLTTARMIAQASSWVITLIVIRLLTPTDYGLQAMVMVVYSLLALITHSGLDRAIARMPDVGETELKRMLGFSLVFNALAMAFVWFAAPFVASYYQEDAVVTLLRVLSVGFIITIFKTIPIGLVWRHLDYRKHALANLIGTISGSLTTLVMALLGFGVWSLISGVLMQSIASAVYLQISTRWLVFPQFTMTGIGALVKYAWTISLSFFVWSFAWQLDIVIGGQKLTAELLGFYVVAINLCNLPMAKVVPLANEVLYPAYAKLQTDRDAVNVYFEKSVSSLCFTLFPAFLGLAAIAKWLVPVLFGPKWIGVEYVMMIVAVAMPFRVVLSMCNPMLNATGSAMTSLTTGVVAMIMIGAAVLIGVNWGVIGLATATLLVSPLLLWYVLWRTKVSSGMPLGFVMAKVGPILAISAVMATMVYGIGVATDGLLSNVAIFILQVVSGALIYVALAAVFARDSLLSTVSIVYASLSKGINKQNNDGNHNGEKTLATSMLKRWVGRASPGGERAKLLILKYHRADSSQEYDSKDHSIGTFETQARLLASSFNSLTVAEASRRIRNGTLPPRALCITFDDGYADNFDIALPTLEKFGLTATFFVPSGLLGDSRMWSDQIANVFATAGENSEKIREYLADAGMPVKYSELTEKLKYMSVDARETIIDGLSAHGSIHHESSTLMTVEQIRELAQRGMEVGGHTVSHTILTNVDEQEAREEIFGCKSQLESIIDMPVLSFAYPNGRRGRDYADRDVHIVREAGFETAVNTEFGLADNSAALFELPRVSQYFVTPLRLFRLYI